MDLKIRAPALLRFSAGRRLGGWRRVISNGLISHQMRQRQRSSWLRVKETSLFPGPFVCKAGFLASPGAAVGASLGLAAGPSIPNGVNRLHCRRMDGSGFRGKWFDRTPALACGLLCLRNPLEECFCSFNPLTFPQSPLVHPLFVYSFGYFINLSALIKCQ